MSSPMTRTQVCRVLGVSPKSLYLWERAGKIPAPSRDRRGWRVYSPEEVEVIRRFLSPAGLHPASPIDPREGSSMSPESRLEGLSARNQLRGTVTSLHGDGVLCEVVLRLGDGQEIVSVVTRSSVERMGLAVGQEATAVIKSTEVMLFK
ncbi:MAG: TOBE domain-containing protein [Armatimonadetes bacterium]|nr:TOBE domain-containing protein [Armatimonadota bacterium]